MTEVVDLWTVQIIVDVPPGVVYTRPKYDDIRAMMAEAEENLTDLLPSGSRARIRRWDQDPDEGDSDE